MSDPIESYTLVDIDFQKPHIENYIAALEGRIRELEQEIANSVNEPDKIAETPSYVLVNHVPVPCWSHRLWAKKTDAATPIKYTHLELGKSEATIETVFNGLNTMGYHAHIPPLFSTSLTMTGYQAKKCAWLGTKFSIALKQHEAAIELAKKST